MLGIYLSGHPLDKYKEAIEELTNVRSLDFIYEEEEDNTSNQLYDGQDVTIGGVITTKTIKTTRNNKMMAFITLEDLYGVVEVIIFPNDYERNKDILMEDAKIFVKGRVSLVEEQDSKIILQRLIPFDRIHQSIYLKIKDYPSYQELENKIIKRLDAYKGTNQVIIYLEKEKTAKQLDNISGARIEKSFVG